MASDKLRPIVQLFFLIKEGNCSSSKTIQEKFNISSRTAYRYVHILKKHFNAPIDYDLAQGGYYLTDPDWDIVKELKNRK